MTNIILVFAGVFALSSLVVFSNMKVRDKLTALGGMILNAIIVGLMFTRWGYWLILDIIAGATFGCIANWASVKSRNMFMKQALKEQMNR